MGFTAVHVERGRLDATLGDLGCGWSWSEIHGRRPRVRLACPACRGPVHAKTSPLGLRFFAQDPAHPRDCTAAGETMAHHLLKLELATAVRAAGWQAELEKTGPGARWRVDVMANSADGSSAMAWEAQISPIGDSDVVDRTRRLIADHIPVCWVAAARHRWVGSVPSIVVEPPSKRGDGWTVAAGVFRFDHDRMPARVLLSQFVGWTLSGQIIAYPDPCPPSLGGRGSWRRVWTAPGYARRAAATEATRVAERHAAAQRYADDRWSIEAAKQRIAAAEREEAERVAIWGRSGSARRGRSVLDRPTYGIGRTRVGVDSVCTRGTFPLTVRRGAQRRFDGVGGVGQHRQ